MDGKRYRIQGANMLSFPAEDAEKLLALGDGECALLYLYILRSGGVLDAAAAARALSRTAEQIGAAARRLGHELQAKAEAQHNGCYAEDIHRVVCLRVELIS